MRDTELGQPLAHHRANRSVGFDEKHDPIAGGKISEQGEPDRRHASRYADRPVTILKLGTERLELPRCRIRIARIIETLVASLGRHCRAKARKRELHRPVDRTDQGLIALRQVDTRLMDDPAFFLHWFGVARETLP